MKLISKVGYQLKAGQNVATSTDDKKSSKREKWRHEVSDAALMTKETPVTQSIRTASQRIITGMVAFTPP